jgi:hypothetical protein
MMDPKQLRIMPLRMPNRMQIVAESVADSNRMPYDGSEEEMPKKMPLLDLAVLANYRFKYFQIL